MDIKEIKSIVEDVVFLDLETGEVKNVLVEESAVGFCSFCNNLA